MRLNIGDMVDQRFKPPALSRRAALGVAASAPLALAPKTAHAAPKLVSQAGVCVLTPEAVEGPFYYDPKLVRADITEGRPGVPLELALTLAEAEDCAPIAGARIDVWHCDAAGAYSGFDGGGGSRPAKRDSFMRGTQMTGVDGVATFRTVYPGWYAGRTPHIHLKAFLEARNVLTTQLYFPDALSEYIYEKVAAYRRGDGPRDTTNATDGILADTENGRSTFVSLREEADRYVASLTIAVNRRGLTSATGRPAGPPPGPDGARRGPPPGPRPEGAGDRPRSTGPLVPGDRT